MIDYLTTSIALLAGTSLLLPLIQMAKSREKRLPGYLLAAVLAIAMALVSLNTLSPTPSPWFGSLLASDQLGGAFALVTLGVTLMVTVGER